MTREKTEWHEATVYSQMMEENRKARADRRFETRLRQEPEVVRGAEMFEDVVAVRRESERIQRLTYEERGTIVERGDYQ